MNVPKTLLPACLSFFFLCLGYISPANATAYNNVPIAIPGVIEFENYDLGGEGVGYHDLDTANAGGLYRQQEGVDIGDHVDGAGGQYSVGWFQTGEWLKYSVTVTTTGTYHLKIRNHLADYQQSNPTQFQLKLDDQFITGNQATSTFSNYYGAFGWQGYSTLPKSTQPPIVAHLTKGNHVFSVHITKGGGGGLNYMHFELVDPLPPDVPVLYPDPSKGQAYYVAPNGNDSNPGSLAQPWKTVSKAAQTAQAGSTVYLRQGTYKERLIPKHSGTSTQYLIFMSYPGERATLDGTGVNLPQMAGLVHIEGREFVQVKDLKIVNAGVNNPNSSGGFWSMGVLIDKSNHIIIDHNLIEHTYSTGISTSVGSHHVLIDGNSITDTNWGNQDTEVALGTYWFAHDVEIRNNTIHHGAGEGIGVAAGPNKIKVHRNIIYAMGQNRNGIGIYIDAWTEDQSQIEVFNNLVKDNASEGIAVSSEGGGLLQDVRIYNNILSNVGSNLGALGVTNWSNTAITNADKHPLKHISIYNNTISGSGVSGRIFINNPEVTDIAIRNNILTGSTCSYPQYQTSGVCIENFRSDRCSGSSCDSLRAQIAAQLTASHNLFGVSPKFVNASAGNFKLQASSPAIDAGIASLAPPFDFDGLARPAGQGVDAGAHEYGATTVLSPTPMPTPSPPSSVCPEDLDADTRIDMSDLLLVLANWGQKGGVADLDRSGLVTITDLILLLNKWGQTCP